ncbi:MAG: enhanced serine sensitivity protein SseB C-terminal domain-containing protein [Gammaproteobacteria bacterium]|nr:enhanced serine sensitivity protein SseB C-terminal domain-containing protein [Gammaproteobacteria bacterium]MBU2002892.1 enhanced serine sensitivity protein SseB C-terminal domain-containing protein [Gammaproteobacteria bacterium]MBU2131615.1 enhanced serine sensitivity protein SseB C-terminal domain-containing protein [Gammaproteobacteria bacterium]MBU2185818.1 enhanced serine sensitivity protein SseB C-terminal domain-containing protein [Gammaproteobacteria bacterium]MBU2424800.1 enhanced
MLYHLEATNPLEQCFEKALSNNAYAEAFYQQLSQAKLFILSEGSEDAPQAGDGAIAISIKQWYIPLEDGSDHPFTPIFTSQTAVDKAIELMKSEGTDYHGVMELEAATIFQLLLQSGNDMALNPNSNMSKTLDEDEIRYMLLPDFSLVEQRGALVILGKVFSDELPIFVELKEILSNYQRVQKAYLIESNSLNFSRSCTDHALCLMVQFVADNADDLSRVRADVDRMQRKMDPNSWEVKVHQMRADVQEPLGQFCVEKAKPFYSQSLFAKMKRWFA